MRLALSALAALALTGCVSFPVPPTDLGGLHAGSLGKLRVYLACKWEPAAALGSYREGPPERGLFDGPEGSVDSSHKEADSPHKEGGSPHKEGDSSHKDEIAK